MGDGDTQDIKNIMHTMEESLQSVGYEGYLLEYLGYVPHDISAAEVQEAAVEFAESMRFVIEQLGMVDVQGALESTFMHGFFVALAWKSKQPA